ncbi:hypothetical protein [Nostoc sp. FACHB-110]|uniref:hypothetical protein n=1 Tax=Nostoc sp. FACHB-110 TaxID=2692834 RepID=UPI00168903F0|nr:hypothetical protein [Nostoc sp. FACHB-110]MBD2435851.1 hypothetical protein [Nostoc sp. FACHB-110]
MSITKIFQATIDRSAQVLNYVSDAVSRIFGPKDDNYPATGVQPFEGDITDSKHKH